MVRPEHVETVIIGGGQAGLAARQIASRHAVVEAGSARSPLAGSGS